MRNRTMLKGAAVALLVLASLLAAGCVGEQSPADSEPTDGSDIGTLDAEDVPTDAKCPVCGMMPHNHPEWNAQIVFQDGETIHLDVPKDTFTYLFNEEQYYPDGKTRDDVARIYFTEYYTTEFVEMNDDLYFVEGSDITGPMGTDLVPVQGRENADTFATDHGGTVLAPDDVTPELVADLKDMGSMDGSMGGMNDSMDME